MNNIRYWRKVGSVQHPLHIVMLICSATKTISVGLQKYQKTKQTESIDNLPLAMLTCSDKSEMLKWSQVLGRMRLCGRALLLKMLIKTCKWDPFQFLEHLQSRLHRAQPQSKNIVRNRLWKNSLDRRLSFFYDNTSLNSSNANIIT